jgi:hypothetical protein
VLQEERKLYDVQVRTVRALGRVGIAAAVEVVYEDMVAHRGEYRGKAREGEGGGGDATDEYNLGKPGFSGLNGEGMTDGSTHLLLGCRANEPVADL